MKEEAITFKLHKLIKIDSITNNISSKDLI